MVAHALCPTKRMEDHWSTQAFGVLPEGTFRRVVRRNRFREISRFLHFPDDEDPRASTDRAWKIRSVLSTEEKTFKDMLPSHNERNPTWTFMKDKPLRWGSKCVALRLDTVSGAYADWDKLLVCCYADTFAYCHRVEMDIGRRGDTDESQAMDTKNGPAAVIRNIASVF
ncbi:hypothetical protein JG687_00017981 [Phytophthora cactorum]|uniref:PiggyBac transposable element-derived protein domain-containing protein n=1 Tax=Phytophthora cactorum TaxID=29920 RepID=A0A8T1TMV2_9STRA|nr:hypothetical protein JG687_00017981 [Phytophthora cactorum]